MNVASLVQIGLFLAALGVAGQAAGLVHGPGLRGQAVRPGLGRRLAGAAHLSRLRDRPGRGNDLDRLRQGDARVQPAGNRGRLRLAAGAGASAAEPAADDGRAARAGHEHGRQFRHQHELAELRRRDDRSS